METLQVIRAGNFNSSTIVALLSNGKREMSPEEKAEWKKDNPKSTKKLIEDSNVLGESALTYIQECNYERRLERAIESEVYAKPLSWGNLCELHVQSKDDLIPLKYEQRPNEPIAHAEFDFWTGTPDMFTSDTVADLKCPFTLKSFCSLVQPLYDGKKGIDAINALRNGYKDSKDFEHKKHDCGEDYYWQLISNACILESIYKRKIKYAELFVYCPYQQELNEIRAKAQEQDGAAGKYYSIAMSNDEDLPYLIEGGYYKNMNVISFEVPQSDKDALTARVKLAGALLEKRVKEIL